jgi:hypothetical protein
VAKPYKKKEEFNPTNTLIPILFSFKKKASKLGINWYLLFFKKSSTTTTQVPHHPRNSPKTTPGSEG